MPREIYPGAPRIHPERVAKLAARRSPRDPRGPFADLPWAQQRAAEQWLWKFCQRWGNDLPPWRRAILIGVAKRLAKNPPEARFAIRLKAHHGAKVVAERCRIQGIEHPRIAAMRIGRERKRAGNPALPTAQLAV